MRKVPEIRSLVATEQCVKHRARNGWLQNLLKGLSESKLARLGIDDDAQELRWAWYV